MSKKEKIVCAAVEVNKYGCNGKYLPMVFAGCYYDDIKKSFLYRKDMSIGAVAYVVDGFITNKNRFIDAKEALEISGLKNQLRFKDRDYLLPEDLY